MFPVDAFRKTLTKATEIFEALSIPYHLTGGITSIAYGEPRLTQGIDLVIGHDATADRIESLLTQFGAPDFLFCERTVRDAVATRGLFQLLDTVEALKLDIYPRELIPGESSRSVTLELFEGIRLPIACRVDAAISKLIWITKGSHKNRRDLRMIFRSSGASEQESIRQMWCGTGSPRTTRRSSPGA